jgi:hypothetical protein
MKYGKNVYRSVYDSSPQLTIDQIVMLLKSIKNNHIPATKRLEKLESYYHARPLYKSLIDIKI